MYRIGIDVGGTNTDAVIIDEDLNIISSIKTSTTDDIYSGILNSLHQLLVNSKVNPKDVTQAMLGTTQCTNAIVERKKLSKIGIIRLGAPATTAISPMIDWPEEFKEYVEEAKIIKGGYEFDGKEIMPLDVNEAREFFKRIKGKVSAVAISCVFSPVRSEHEYIIAKIAKEVLGDEIHISLSSEIGSLSLIERENACILNAMLHEVSKSFTEGFYKSLKDEGITNAELYLSQNDGTLMTAEYARKYPILTVACGPTNSIRGASYLTSLKNALVVDIGGTTTDIGVIQNSFPRESSVAVTIGGVRTNFRMPDVISIGLGGGSIVREKDGKITVGPESVGYNITREAIVFGGNTITATDIAAKLGMANIGNIELLKDIDIEFAKRAMEVIKEMIEDTIDKMKTTSDDVEVVLVGGGAIISPTKLIGASDVVKSENSGIANAIGSAISKVSGSCERLFSYDEIPREKALEIAKTEAIEQAIKGGAIEDSIEILEVEDVPLAYHPGNTCKVKVKVAGDLK